MMRLAAVRRLRAPNSYLPCPVLVGRVHVAEPAGRTTAEVAGIADRLLADLPGLAGQPCDVGADGFATVLRGGTHAGHVAEHIVRELSARIGREVAAGRTDLVAESGSCDIVTACPPDEPADSTVGERLLRLAVDLLDAYLAGHTTPALADELAAIGEEHVRETLGPSTAAVAAAARERGIPVERIGAFDLLRLGHGRHRRLVRAAMTDGTSAVGVAASRDRLLARQLLTELGLPVPPGGSVVTAEQAVGRFAALGSPVMVRPRHGPTRPGAWQALRTAAEVRQAYADAAAHAGEVIVESLPAGRDYRVLVVAGRIVSVTEWRPDDSGSGGAVRDVTGGVHPDVDELCRRAVAATGLDVAGIDLRLPDVAEPLPPAGPGGDPAAVITALTAGPDLSPFGLTGQPRDAFLEPGRAIVDALYPVGVPSRVPTVAVTGGATADIARLVSHLLGEGGRRVGLAEGGCARVADRPVERSPGSGTQAAQIVLGDPTVDVAVLVVDPVGLSEGGLGYDWTDVAVIMDGPAAVESVVAERVRDGGTLVLHAGARAAELVAYPAVRAGRKQVVLFDVDPGSPAIRQHVHAGGCAYVLDGGWVTQLKDCYKVRVVPVSELDRGPAQWRVADALAAVAAAVAHGLSPTTIRRRLATLDVPERVEAAATVIRFETVLPDPSRPDAGAPVAIREAA